MKLTNWFLAILFFIISAIFVGQLNYIQSTSANPLTSAISTPISYFTYKVRGNISYRILDALKNGVITPASNISVVVSDNKTNQKTITTTDALGNYTFNLKPGIYTVTPSDDKKTTFNPINRQVTITNQDLSKVDFSGDLIPQNTIGASFTPDKAVFSFPTKGNSNYRVDLSTYKDMSWDVYLGFGTGTNSPIIVTNPQKWAKYSCGQTLYWRVVSNNQNLTPIQATKVECPPGYQVVNGVFSGLYTTQSGPVMGQPVPNNIGFGFNYSVPSALYQVDVSTTPDMSWDVYLNFVSGSSTNLSVINPQAKWAKFTCGQTLYWRVYNYNRTVSSPISSFTVVCPQPVITPPPSPMPSSSPVPTVSPKPVITPKPSVTPIPSPVVTPPPSPYASPVLIPPSPKPVATASASAKPVTMGRPVQVSPLDVLRNLIFSILRIK